jgi:lipopolysaccharide transport system permease protein
MKPISPRFSRVAWTAELIAYRAYTALASEAARTYLGVAWWILEPIFLVGVYYLVFGLFLGFRGELFFPNLVVGLIAWQWFNRSVMNSVNSITNKGAVVSKIDVSRLMFPLSDLFADLFKAIIVFTTLLVVLRWIGVELQQTAFLMPAILAVHALFVTAVSLWVALLAPFAPDLRYVIALGLRGLLLGSGVFYSVNQIPEEFRDAFLLNPVAAMIESYRRVLVTGETPLFIHLGVVTLASVLLIGGAIVLERRLRVQFARVLVS